MDKTSLGHLSLAESKLDKFKLITQDNIDPTWIVYLVYYGFYHTTCALLNVYSDKAYAAFKQGRKLKHQGALGIFSAMFCTPHSVYRYDAYLEVYNKYRTALVEREHDAYSLVDNNKDNGNLGQKVLDMALCLERYIRSAQYLLEREAAIRSSDGSADSRLAALKEAAALFPNLSDWDEEDDGITAEIEAAEYIDDDTEKTMRQEDSRRRAPPTGR